MAWIKCTDRMPPDMEPVIITVENYRERYVMTEARYNADFDLWEWLYEAGADYWKGVDGKVTHWMPMPKPAED